MSSFTRLWRNNRDGHRIHWAHAEIPSQSEPQGRLGGFLQDWLCFGRGHSEHLPVLLAALARPKEQRIAVLTFTFLDWPYYAGQSSFHQGKFLCFSAKEGAFVSQSVQFSVFSPRLMFHQLRLRHSSKWPRHNKTRPNFNTRWYDINIYQPFINADCIDTISSHHCNN